MNLPVFDTKGIKKGTITLAPAIFGAKVIPQLMAQAVRVYLSNQRQSPAKIKGKDELAFTGRKMYRQKGTGRARHGSRKVGVFVKGAKAFGPTGEQNYKLALNKKMRRLALFSSLTGKLKDKAIIVVDGLEKIQPKTKLLAKIINKLCPPTGKKKGKILLVLPQVLSNVNQAANNINNVQLSLAKMLTCFEIIKADKIIFTKSSIAVIKDHWLKN